MPCPPGRSGTPTSLGLLSSRIGQPHLGLLFSLVTRVPRAQYIDNSHILRTKVEFEYKKFQETKERENKRQTKSYKSFWIHKLKAVEILTWP
jgi:hypothetical protein